MEFDYWRVMNKGRGKDRYIWQNRLVWWANITLINKSGSLSKRVRFSLNTRDVVIARKRRDRVIRAINKYRGKIGV